MNPKIGDRVSLKNGGTTGVVKEASGNNRSMVYWGTADGSAFTSYVDPEDIEEAPDAVEHGSVAAPVFGNTNTPAPSVPELIPNISSKSQQFELGACESCIKDRFGMSLLEIMHDDEPRRCAFCEKLRRPLYVVWVTRG